MDVSFSEFQRRASAAATFIYCTAAKNLERSWVYLVPCVVPRFVVLRCDNCCWCREQQRTARGPATQQAATQTATATNQPALAFVPLLFSSARQREEVMAKRTGKRKGGCDEDVPRGKQKKPAAAAAAAPTRHRGGDDDAEGEWPCRSSCARKMEAAGALLPSRRKAY